MQKVHDHIIRQFLVDVVDKIAEVQRYICELSVSLILCLVEHFIDQQILRVIDNVGLQLRLLQDLPDLLVSCPLCHLKVLLEW